ncbi:hypothetical protein ElyMa_002058300 [Elysia marginata]|uniref:Uncharacterized protein n=1 Tax=Elysia marginata TaxID=1093978 RepID=A0AAV4FAU1_9GAST|nr:hypothetical protein ElyMa_002058300 [Elysia marginata]
MKSQCQTREVSAKHEKTVPNKRSQCQALEVGAKHEKSVPSMRSQCNSMRSQCQAREGSAKQEKSVPTMRRRWFVTCHHPHCEQDVGCTEAGEIP